jgi:predicted DNA-binding transcriptional regulator AlpA
MEDILLQALKEGRGLFVVSGKDLLDFHKQTMADARKEKESLLMDSMLNADEVMTLLSTTRRTLYRWGEEGYLKSVRIGGVDKWRRRDVLRLMNGGEPVKK